MSPWFLLVIPLIAIAVSAFYFYHKVVWWELLLLLAIPTLFIFLFKTITVSSLNSATEYRGYYIVEARYYESWETWVSKTCSYTTCSGSGKTRTCTTHYYDCSYCDKNPAYYTVVDNYGREYGIEKEDYLYLIKIWKATPKFVELNRNIKYRGSCGKDGDMYSIRWNNQWNTSLNIVTTHSYVNRVLSAKSAFNYQEVTEGDKKKYGLYEYPQIYGLHRQDALLGADTMYNGSYLHAAKKKFEFFNGYYGVRKHVKVFVLLYYNKPLSAAKKQEAYWVGGNDNEVVVCIGVDKSTRKLQWVKTFSWAINKRVIVDCREDIMNDIYFNPYRVYDAIEKSVVNNFKPRNLDKDFDYLEADLPTWTLWFCGIATLVITILLTNYFIHNEFEN